MESLNIFNHTKGVCFYEEIQEGAGYFLNLDLPPLFDDYEVPLVYMGEEYSEFTFDSSIDLNQPPKFDKYGDEEALGTGFGVGFTNFSFNAQRLHASFNSGQGFVGFVQLIPNTIDALEFQICQGHYLADIRVLWNALGPSKFRGCYFGDSQAHTDAVMFRNLICSQVQFTKREERPGCSLLEYRSMFQFIENDELKDSSSSLLMFNVDCAFNFVKLVFDPGGLSLVSGFVVQHYSLEHGFDLTLMLGTSRCLIDHIKSQRQSDCYLVDYQAEKGAATVKKSSVATIAKGPCYLSDCGVGFSLISECNKSLANPIEFQDQTNYYLIGYTETRRASSCLICWLINTVILCARINEIVSDFKAPCYSLGSDYEHVVTFTGVQEFSCSFRFVWAAATVEYSRSLWLFDNVAHDELIRLVHGGWWGVWHKDITEIRRTEELLALFIFDPGGLKLQELRTILI